MKFKSFLTESIEVSQIENQHLVTFYKAIPNDHLKNSIIPGTVTKSYKEAYIWWERYNSKKKNIKGAAKHIDKKPSSIISFTFDANNIADHSEFQKAGVSEHDRKTCWTAADKTKAQINTKIDKYKIVLDSNGTEK